MADRSWLAVRRTLEAQSLSPHPGSLSQHRARHQRVTGTNRAAHELSPLVVGETDVNGNRREALAVVLPHVGRSAVAVVCDRRGIRRGGFSVAERLQYLRGRVE